MGYVFSTFNIVGRSATSSFYALILDFLSTSFACIRIAYNFVLINSIVSSIGGSYGVMCGIWNES